MKDEIQCLGRRQDERDGGERRTNQLTNEHFILPPSSFHPLLALLALHRSKKLSIALRLFQTLKHDFHLLDR
jgi:hypothetical protein